ncbi:type II toxin-antitoxin system RelE/ParE family toxin [Hellea balneolensis]|uniref:type II toxin-antitoxin system RelE/ParE family toxin n=1 Tax=Hellea balneolensis TaxID=287478 RepID=UPI0003F83197|nr:type II toxin-antitoxin system RelE/ParE family toxin [Hellea balneolensis]
MRRVKWAEKAEAEFLEAIDYISDDNPNAAEAVRQRIIETANLLGRRPIGRPGRMLNVYEKTVLKTSYILAYEVTDEEINIIRVIHSAQNWTPQNWPKD